MPFKIDFTDSAVLEWYTTPDGIRVREETEYTPTIYVSAETGSHLACMETHLNKRGDVAEVDWERWRTAFRNDSESVLRVDVTTLARVRPLAGWIRRYDRPGTYRLYNVDFSPQFRYCLEQDCSPAPQRELRQATLSDPTPGTPSAPIQALTIDGQSVDGRPDDVLDTVERTLVETDPDILVVSSAELIPALFETATQLGYDLQLGRRPGYTRLAGRSTYESYGQVGHSPARYNVPGRAIVDRSNSFFYHETNLAGCFDLVERSWKPIQELAWASIGNVLTAIQIREALSRGVLVPWKSWRHEFPKTMRQLHEGDRGGFTFAPDVGLHEDVHELDFSSLYPNIICTRNISPETIRCDCHDREDVPGLGYSICDESGYLPDVLQPIIDDRDTLKRELKRTDDAETCDVLDGQAEALKWILVSCFGYQGFSNAKFGRIECHEAINAFAREILLDAKERLEDAGWQVVHGIVDSLWVRERNGTDQRPLDVVADEITNHTGIRLEYEAAYDWIAFVPLRTSEAGALTKYFGRRRDGSFKYRGIECRQRSTTSYVAECQRELVETLDRTRDPAAVCAHLASWIDRLGTGSVDPSLLQITQRASKSLEEYTQSTRTTAALRRAATCELTRYAGQDVTYVVVDDSRGTQERVRLAHESSDGYDEAFYRERLLRAAESVLSPLGWRQSDIESELADRTNTTLQQYSDPTA